jgi:hypothetical protein
MMIARILSLVTRRHSELPFASRISGSLSMPSPEETVACYNFEVRRSTSEGQIEAMPKAE